MKLSPRINLELTSLLAEPKRIIELAEAFGSPLNIVFPEQAAQNFKAFSAVLAHSKVRSRIFFAHKANSSSAIARRLALEPGANIDVASEFELSHALSSGFSGERIEATGPKGRHFLYLAIMHSVTINADSLQEIEHISSLCSELSKKAQILVRVSGFAGPLAATHAKDSRFGTPLGQLEPAFEKIASDSNLNLKGLSFHLDTAELSEKVSAIVRCVKIMEDARTKGLNPTVLNIGGGFKMRHFHDPEEWSEYSGKLKDGLLGQGERLSWNGMGFGLRPEEGRTRGVLENFGDTSGPTGPVYLEELLDTYSEELGGTIGDTLSDLMAELWVEPGCALLDQAGATLASVRGVTATPLGKKLIGLAMKRTDLSFVDKEYFADPILVSATATQSEAPEGGAYIAGNLCLESDLIFRHKYFPDALPQSGDVLVFANTAGYMMDFSAAASIMQPLAEKIAVECLDGVRWFRDEAYLPAPARNRPV